MTTSEAALYSSNKGAAELEGLYRDIAMGLHTASQPLTVLRAGLSPKMVQVLTPSELREFAETSAAAVEQACLFFDLTRELVNTAAIEGCSIQFDIAAIIKSVAERSGSELEHSGVSLEISIQNRLPEALGDKALASKAIAIALRAASLSSRAGQVIAVTACGTETHVELWICSSCCNPNTPKAETLLQLSLLRAILKKQYASFSYELSPFQLRMAFKRAQAESN